MKVLNSFSALFFTTLRRRGLSLAAASGVLSLLTAAGCGQLAQKERELTFRIEPGTAGWYSGLPSGIIESSLPVPSDELAGGIHTWWWPAEQADAPTLLYLHGARWNLTGHVFRIQQLREGGLPSEDTVYEDARIAWQHLSRLQPDPDKRFIYGHSLGGAVAVELAHSLDKDEKEKSAAGLIVESSFTSLADVARTFSYRWLPIQLLLTQKFDSLKKIRKIDMPVLIVHGSDDPYIPAHFSEALHAAARTEKHLLLVEGGTHNNSLWVGETEYRAALKALFGWNPRKL